jgi:hypothetical protein
VFALDLPLWAGMSTFVSSLILVIAIDTLVLMVVFRQPACQAASLVFRANVVSTLIGAFLSFYPLLLLSLIIVPWVAVSMARKRFGWQKRQLVAVAVTIVLGIIILLFPQPTILRTIVQFYATIIGAFALTVFFEAAVFARKTSPRIAWKWSLIANSASYAVLFAILLLMGFRSGAFAIREFHVAQLRRAPHQTAEQRIAILRQLEEYEMWQQSGARSAIRGGEQSSPFMELVMVQSWAKNGYVDDARELLALVNRYTPTHTEWDAQFWRDAEDSVSSTSLTRRGRELGSQR